LSDHKDQLVKAVQPENEVIPVHKDYKESLVFPDLLEKKDPRVTAVPMVLLVVLDHQVSKDILVREVNKDLSVLLD
jgi:hypothetical protein